MWFAQHIDATFIPAPHLKLIAKHLEDVQARHIRRLMIFAPPRHGKSKLASELFPAWALGVDPTEQFIITSRNVDLANTFSRNVRNMINTERYIEIFPDVQLSDDSATIQKWTLAGYTRPAMLTAGVGGAPTGQGAKILIIDDPIGNYQQAESAIDRENTYKWYTDTIYPRLEPQGAVILMMQRWHEDDLAGRLLRDQAKADKWTVLSLPALTETQAERDQMAREVFQSSVGEPDPLGRRIGEPLWPERFNADVLNGIQRVSPRQFQAKYQQRPRPAEGSKFKRAWLQKRVDAAPSGLRWVRYYDLAYSLKQTADYTASVSAAMDRDGTIYLRAGWFGRMETPDIRKKIKETMLAERKVRHGVESALHGAGVVQDLRRDRELVSISLTPVHVDTDKAVRATPVADRAEGGQLVFVRESPNDDVWIDAWIDEMASFPFGEHDDRVDTVSGCFAMVTNTPGWTQFAEEQLEKSRQPQADTNEASEVNNA